MKEKNTIKVADFTSDPIQLGIDLFVMPKGAKHVDLAEKFLNYICTAEVMAKNLEEFPYSCPNDAAVAAASDDYKNDPARFLLQGKCILPGRCWRCADNLQRLLSET